MSLGFTTGLRALLAARAAMDVIGHNLANVNTPGYSRQLPLLQTTKPALGLGLNAFGTGVQVSGVVASVNEPLLGRIRAETALASRFGAEASLLEQVEAMLGDLTGNGISAGLADFFDQASAAAQTPEDLTQRQSLLGSAGELATLFRLRAEGLSDLRASAIVEIQGTVAEANGLLEQVAALNFQIKTQEQIGAAANDLRDQRSVALEKLADLIGAQATPVGDGTVNVSVGGATIVTGDSATEISAEVLPDGTFVVGFGSSSLDVNQMGGRVAGLVDLVNEFLPERLAQLDEVARSLIYAANRIHARGVPVSGPYTSLVGTQPVTAVDPKSAFGVPLADLGLPFAMKKGTVSVAVSDLATGDVKRYDIAVDPEKMSLSQLLAAFDAIPGLEAQFDGTGRLRIHADSGYGFDFSKRLDPNPVEGGTFGSTRATLVAGADFPVALTPGDQLQISVDGGPPQTVTFQASDFADIQAATAEEVAAAIAAQTSGVDASVVDGKLVLQSTSDGASSQLTVTDVTGTPSQTLELPASAQGADTGVSVHVSGAPASDEPHTYTFEALGDGEIGVTPGLQVRVRDENGFPVAVLDVGEGYEPGDPIEFADGMTVSFSPGSIQGSANQFFRLEAPGDTDTADLLVAFGLGALFEGSDAKSIALAGPLEDQPAALAGAAYGGPGDGGVFLDLAELSSEAAPGQSSTLLDLYGAFAAEVGNRSASAQANFDASSIVLLTLQTQRAAESGVNPDEELLLLDQFQLAYESAAKFLQTLRDLDDTLLSL